MVKLKSTTRKSFLHDRELESHEERDFRDSDCLDSLLRTLVELIMVERRQLLTTWITSSL